MYDADTRGSVSTKDLARLDSAKRDQGGFTLIEMIVSVGLFAVVMVICVSTLLALVNANRKAQALQSVINNLNITLDSMARSIREGSSYHCGSSVPFTGTRDCTSGDTEFNFLPFGGDPSNFNGYWFYEYDPSTKRIYKSEDGGNTFYPVTAPEVTIDSLTFYVVGTTRGDATQPKVVIVVKGTAAANSQATRTSFHIQVAATQRLIDL